MYQNIYYDRNNGLVHLWDDEKKYTCFPYERYAYVIDSKGLFTTMTGLKVKKVSNWSKEAEKQNLVFEHDVPVLTRVLIDRYYQSDEVSKNHTILFLDIEVAKEEKYSEAKDAYNTITSIVYYSNQEKIYRCLLLDEEENITNSIIDGIDLKRFSSEQELLVYFLNDYKRISPTIITTWNGDTFDMPYLFNRCRNVLGDNWALRLSPINIVEPREYGRDYQIKIAGVSQLDYLQLYKTYTYNEEPRYTLDAIAKKELGRGKVVYEGSLDDLFKSNPLEFARYNKVDVELLVDLDKKLDFIDIARGICHKGHVPYEDFTMSSRYLDGASLVYCKRKGIVAAKGIQSEDKSTAEGAFVKLPKPGLYQYIYDVDATSLYPSNIMSLNISPETLFGKVHNWDESDWTSGVDKELNIEVYVNYLSDSLFGSKSKKFSIQQSEFQVYLTENNLSIASNGCMYKMDIPGLIPSILDSWFSERKEYNKIASERKLSGDLDGYRYYDKKQLVTKILLNSFYGVLLLPTFRFYNRDNGEAVTITGQSLIKYAMKIANMVYNKKLGTDTDYVIAGDTDSVFLPALPLIRLSYEGNDKDRLITETINVINEVQSLINQSFNVYAMKLHNIKTHRWEVKQELVASRAFWGDAKKRYAMWIVFKKGLPVDELEVKGMDMVRSSFPQAFRTFQKEVITDILHDIPYTDLNSKIYDFKQTYKKEPLNNIMLPTSVKEYSKYSYGQKGTPIHVKSAQNYNKLLDLFKIERLPKMDDGDKILWAYLKQNPYGFDTIAIRGYEDPKEIIDFVEKFIDKEEIFNRSLMSKLQDTWDNLGWGKIILEQNNDFF